MDDIFEIFPFIIGGIVVFISILANAIKKANKQGSNTSARTAKPVDLLTMLAGLRGDFTQAQSEKAKAVFGSGKQPTQSSQSQAKQKNIRQQRREHEMKGAPNNVGLRLIFVILGSALVYFLLWALVRAIMQGVLSFFLKKNDTLNASSERRGVLRRPRSQ